MLLTFLTTKLLPPTSHHQPHPLHCPCPLSVPIPTQLWGFSKISCNVFTVPQARSSPLHKDPTPAMSHLSASWEYLGLGTSSPSSLQQHRKVRNKPDGGTATVLGTPSSPVCPQCCSCPLWGQCASCYTTSCPSRHSGSQLSPCLSLQVTLHTGLPVPEFYASRSAMP